MFFLCFLCICITTYIYVLSNTYIYIICYNTYTYFRIKTKNIEEKKFNLNCIYISRNRSNCNQVRLASIYLNCCFLSSYRLRLCIYIVYIYIKDIYNKRCQMRNINLEEVYLFQSYFFLFHTFLTVFYILYCSSKF